MTANGLSMRLAVNNNGKEDQEPSLEKLEETANRHAILEASRKRKDGVDN